jgi:hypothetical protein
VTHALMQTHLAMRTWKSIKLCKKKTPCLWRLENGDWGCMDYFMERACSVGGFHPRKTIQS